MKTQQVILTTTLTAALAALTRQRFVTTAGAVPAAGGKVLGVVDSDTDLGAPVPVNLMGLVLVEAGAAIAADVDVESDATGRAITRTTGSIGGRAIDVATAAGEFIRIARGLPG